MQRKLLVFLAISCLVVAVVCWMGVGYYSSSSAVQDLKAELESIYGMEYMGKEADNGREDMVFVVEPKTWFLTNWDLRNALRIDYEYECRVVFTTYVDESIANVRTVTYQAVDPMGTEKMAERAYLVLNSKIEENRK